MAFGAARSAIRHRKPAGCRHQYRHRGGGACAFRRVHTPWANAANAVNAALYQKLSFDFIRDITPVAGVARILIVIVVSPSFPANTLPELIAYAKSNPGKVTMASPFRGTVPHLSAVMFKGMTGIDVRHESYPSDAQALTDLLGGKVQVQFSGLGAAIEYIRTGKLRALAVTAATRSQAATGRPDRG
jgi:tripartite-type tricarboxylate transporter receptor subunit TctC